MFAFFLCLIFNQYDSECNELAQKDEWSENRTKYSSIQIMIDKVGIKN